MRPLTSILIALWLLGGVAAAQKRSLTEENKRKDQRREDPARYEAMLDAYVAGDLAHSVELLTDPEWDETRLISFVGYLKYAGGGSRWTANRWCAAALMHVDVALAIPGGLPSPGAQMHLNVTGELVGLGLREKGQHIVLFAERLYVAVARLMLDSGHAMSAERVLGVARTRLPNRASILYASASLAELFATHYALAGAVTFTSSNTGVELPFDSVMRRRMTYLNEAATWLRQAAALIPVDDLLRVHLGHVLSLKKEDDEAARLLTGVVNSARDDATVYLASLFLGGLRERQGKMDDAIAAYRVALSRFPAGHAAAVGLSESLQRTGRGDEARTVLRDLVSEAQGPTREPLWWYLFDPPGLAEERLEALRKEVRQ